MVDRFKHRAKLDNILNRLDEEQLNNLYLRVFNTDDGQLVLKDLANRCFVDTTTGSERDEGARAVYLSIQTRIYNAVNKQKKEDVDV